MCESPRTGVGRGANFLSGHEIAQERLYRLWRAGWVTEEFVQLWAESLARLQEEGDCDYLMWLLHTFPALQESNAASSSAL